MNTTQKKKQLKYLNCYTSVFTTYKQATKNFQKANSLVVDGLFGTNTEKKSILIWKDIQSKLTDKGYSCGTIDGLVGNKTISAIKKFQKANGLAVDGIVGNKTMAKLNATSVYMTDEDWKNSKYFKKSEFKCPCGKCNGYGKGIYKSLVDNMNVIRKKYGVPITITSGYRCQTYNDSLIGSSKTSKHLTGQACDWYCSLNKSQSKRVEIMNYIKTLPNYNYTYCNIDNNYPNMGNAIHFDVK